MKVKKKPTSNNNILEGENFKKFQKSAKRLGAKSLDYSKRKL